MISNNPVFNNLSAAELNMIREFIEENDDFEASPELAALIADEWPWLLEKVRLPAAH
jgi:hypothetical protein